PRHHVGSLDHEIFVELQGRAYSDLSRSQLYGPGHNPHRGIHRQKVRKFEGGTAKAYAQIILEDEIHEKTRANEEKKRAQAEAFINRFRAQASKAKLVQSRIKMLERLPKLDELADIESLDFEFRHAPFTAKTLLEARDLSFGYAPDRLLFRGMNLTINPHAKFA